MHTNSSHQKENDEENMSTTEGQTENKNITQVIN